MENSFNLQNSYNIDHYNTRDSNEPGFKFGKKKYEIDYKEKVNKSKENKKNLQSLPKPFRKINKSNTPNLDEMMKVTLNDKVKPDLNEYSKNKKTRLKPNFFNLRKKVQNDPILNNNDTFENLKKNLNKSEENSEKNRRLSKKNEISQNKTKKITKIKPDINIWNTVSKNMNHNIELLDQLRNQKIQNELLEILRNTYKTNGLITNSEFNQAKTALESNFISVRKLGIIIISLQFKWVKNGGTLAKKAGFLIIKNYVIISNKDFVNTYQFREQETFLHNLDEKDLKCEENEIPFNSRSVILSPLILPKKVLFKKLLERSESKTNSHDNDKLNNSILNNKSLTKTLDNQADNVSFQKSPKNKADVTNFQRRSKNSRKSLNNSLILPSISNSNSESDSYSPRRLNHNKMITRPKKPSSSLPKISYLDKIPANMKMNQKSYDFVVQDNFYENKFDFRERLMVDLSNSQASDTVLYYLDIKLLQKKGFLKKRLREERNSSASNKKSCINKIYHENLSQIVENIFKSVDSAQNKNKQKLHYHIRGSYDCEAHVRTDNGSENLKNMIYKSVFHDITLKEGTRNQIPIVSIPNSTINQNPNDVNNSLSNYSSNELENFQGQNMLNPNLSNDIIAKIIKNDMASEKECFNIKQYFAEWDIFVKQIPDSYDTVIFLPIKFQNTEAEILPQRPIKSPLRPKTYIHSTFLKSNYKNFNNEYFNFSNNEQKKENFLKISVHDKDKSYKNLDVLQNVFIRGKKPGDVDYGFNYIKNPDFTMSREKVIETYNEILKESVRLLKRRQEKIKQDGLCGVFAKKKKLIKSNKIHKKYINISKVDEMSSKLYSIEIAENIEFSFSAKTETKKIPAVLGLNGILIDKTYDQVIHCLLRSGLEIKSEKLDYSPSSITPFFTPKSEESKSSGFSEKTPKSISSVSISRSGSLKKISKCRSEQKKDSKPKIIPKKKMHIKFKQGKPFSVSTISNKKNSMKCSDINRSLSISSIKSGVDSKNLSPLKSNWKSVFDKSDLTLASQSKNLFKSEFIKKSLEKKSKPTISYVPVYNKDVDKLKKGKSDIKAIFAEEFSVGDFCGTVINENKNVFSEKKIILIEKKKLLDDEFGSAKNYGGECKVSKRYKLFKKFVIGRKPEMYRFFSQESFESMSDEYFKNKDASMATKDYMTKVSSMENLFENSQEQNLCKNIDKEKQSDKKRPLSLEKKQVNKDKINSLKNLEKQSHDSTIKPQDDKTQKSQKSNKKLAELKIINRNKHPQNLINPNLNLPVRVCSSYSPTRKPPINTKLQPSINPPPTKNYIYDSTPLKDPKNVSYSYERILSNYRNSRNINPKNNQDVASNHYLQIMKSRNMDMILDKNDTSLLDSKNSLYKYNLYHFPSDKVQLDNPNNFGYQKFQPIFKMEHKIPRIETSNTKEKRKNRPKNKLKKIDNNVQSEVIKGDYDRDDQNLYKNSKNCKDVYSYDNNIKKPNVYRTTATKQPELHVQTHQLQHEVNILYQSINFTMK